MSTGVARSPATSTVGCQVKKPVSNPSGSATAAYAAHATPATRKSRPASVTVGLRSRLPTWPLSPTADGPAIVGGEVHHPVRAAEIQTTEWLTIPERGLSTGVAIFGAVGSGKTSACMPPFARQLLSWQANNPDRRVAALVLEVKGDYRRRRVGESGVVC